jgi:alpha-tubulin suppressor-like RCC1 family protein
VVRFPRARVVLLSLLVACSLLIIPLTPARGVAATLPPCNANGVLCGWGDNTAGALGVDGVANTFSSGPVAIESLTDVVAVTGSGQFGAASAFTLTLRRDGTVWAWGAGGNGQLGNGSRVSSRVPVPVSNLTNVAAIATGDQTGYALRTDGTVWAWGSGSAGQLGNHQQCTTSVVPVPVQGLSDVKAIAAGGVTAYALRSDGRVVAWGSNSRGAIGNGETSPFRNTYADCYISDEHDVLSPVAVSGLSNVVALAGGFGDGYALKSDGTVWAWGSGALGALGNGDTSEADALTPVQVKGLPQIQAVVGSSAGYAAYALGSGALFGPGDSMARVISGMAHHFSGSRRPPSVLYLSK